MVTKAYQAAPSVATVPAQRGVAPLVARVAPYIREWLRPSWQTWEGGFVTWCPPTPCIAADAPTMAALTRLDLVPVVASDVARIVHVNGLAFLVVDDRLGGTATIWADRTSSLHAAQQRLILGFPLPRPWPEEADAFLPPLTYGTLALRLDATSCTCVALQALGGSSRAVQHELSARIHVAYEQLARHQAEAALREMEAGYPFMEQLRGAYDAYLCQPQTALPLVDGHWGRPLTQQRYHRWG
ncbi:MAG: hypothetical protein H0X24_09940 [Ktedonobacterales bacterium]|nr:hypothetical protein [Ktedonobacterales bacterium]